MHIFDVILLAILQGFTEFLPVSSSGHLVLAQAFFNIQNPEIVAFDVFLHFGTLLSVIFFFRNELKEILGACIRACLTLRIREEYYRTEYFRLGIILLIGSIPAGIVGFIYHRQIEESFTDPKLIAMNIVLTGLILFLTRLAKAREGKKIGVLSSIFIGVAQAIAVLPGISRSGLTMSTALFLKIPPVQAARFSFLLSIPVIVAATGFEFYKILEYGAAIGFFPICLGIIFSASTGLIAIHLLLRIMEKGKFSAFALYCLGIGIIGIVYI